MGLFVGLFVGLFEGLFEGLFLPPKYGGNVEQNPAPTLGFPRKYGRLSLKVFDSC